MKNSSFILRTIFFAAIIATFCLTVQGQRDNQSPSNTRSNTGQTKSRTSPGNNAKTQPSASPVNAKGAGNNMGPRTDQNKNVNNKNSNINNNKSTNINSNKNVNVNKNTNVNVNKNVNVNVNHTVYARPAPRPYYYHPYTPYHYGPAFHPVGFFIAAIAVTAVAVSVANQKYYYDAGVYYSKSSNGYVVIPAPPGAVITALPPGNTPVVVVDNRFYYYGGAYYVKENTGYKVVEPPIGAIVTNIPEGGKEVEINGIKYVKINDSYYQPVKNDGKDAYQVAEVKK